MKTSNLVTLLNSSLALINVQFKDHQGKAVGREYTYKSHVKDLVVGDEVVVDSPYTGATVAIVSSLTDIANVNLNAAHGYTWIIGKVDKTGHADRLAKDEEITKALADLQLKAARTKLTEDLAKELGFSSVEECDELKALIAKING